MSRILVISDLHEPCSRPRAIEFCKDTKRKYRCNTVLFIGDVIDCHSISFHAAHPDMPGPKDEHGLAYDCIQKWRLAFPRARVCLGNHDRRIVRLAESVNIPAKYIRDYSDVWNTPKWEWGHEFVIDDVLYTHGDGAGTSLYPAYNKMKSMGMSCVLGHFHTAGGIKWLVNPLRRMFGMDVGCVDRDTEYLSPSGWKPIGDYVGGLVGQYKENGMMEFIQPLSYIKQPANILNHFETKYGVSQTLSNEHRMIFVDRNGCLRIKPAKNVFEQHSRDSNGFRGKFITTFSSQAEGISFTDEQLRVQVAFFADGTFNRGYPCITFRKTRKIKRMEMLLKKANISYKKWKSKNTLDVRFWFEPPLKEKRFPLSWYQATQNQLKIIADESLLWDGDQKSVFNSKYKQDADFIQYAFSASGRRASIKEKPNGKNNIWVVMITLKNSTLVSLASTKKTEIQKIKTVDGHKYCFEVPSGLLVFRNNGCIFISGNSLVDDKSMAFAYAKSKTLRSVLSCGVVLDGIPHHVIMECGKNEKYWDGNGEK